MSSFVLRHKRHLKHLAVGFAVILVLWWAAALFLKAQLPTIGDKVGLSWQQADLKGLPFPYKLTLAGLELKRGGETVAIGRATFALSLGSGLPKLRFELADGIDWRGNSIARVDGITGFNAENISLLLTDGEINIRRLPALSFKTACLALGSTPRPAAAVADCPPPTIGDDAKRAVRVAVTDIRSHEAAILSRLEAQWHEDPPIAAAATGCPSGICLLRILADGGCEVLHQWSEGGGVLELDRLALTDVEGNDATALGTFALDSQKKLLAAAEVSAEQLINLLNAYRKLQGGSDLNAVIFVLTFLDKYQNNNKPLSVTLQNGNIAVLGIDLGKWSPPKFCR